MVKIKGLGFKVVDGDKEVILVTRVIFIVGIPPRLTSFRIISSQISSKILHFVPTWLAGRKKFMSPWKVIAGILLLADRQKTEV